MILAQKKPIKRIVEQTHYVFIKIDFFKWRFPLVDRARYVVVFPSRPTLRADSLTDKLSATANARLFIMITMCDMLMIVMMAFIPHHHHLIWNMLS